MPKYVDWINVRKDYEEKGSTLEVLAITYDCSTVSIYNRVRAEEWKKPLLEQIAEDGDEVDETSNPPPPIQNEDEESLDIESLTIENAVYRQKCILARLMNELEATTAHIGQMKKWIAEDTREDRTTNRRRAMYNAISMGARAVMLKNASAALKTLCEVEGMSGLQPKGKKASVDQAAKDLMGKFAIQNVGKDLHEASTYVSERITKTS